MTKSQKPLVNSFLTSAVVYFFNHWFIFHGNCMENSVLSVPSLKNFFEIFFGLIIIFVDHFLSPPQMPTLRRVSPQSSAPDLFRPKLKQNLPNVLIYYPSRVWHIPKPCFLRKRTKYYVSVFLSNLFQDLTIFYFYLFSLKG